MSLGDKKQGLTLAEVAASCQKPNYKTSGNWMVRTFLRDWAVPCSWLCLRAGITANQVTWAAIVIAVIGAVLVSLPGQENLFFGAMFLQVWYYLDHVDGQIARVSRTASLTGRFFDFVMHHFVHGIVSFGTVLYLSFYMQNFWLVYAAGIASISVMTFNLLHDAKFKTFYEAAQKQAPFHGQSAKELEQSVAKRSWAQKTFSWIHKANEVHVMMNILSFAAVTGFFTPDEALRSWLSLFYALTPVTLAAVKLIHILKAKQIDREYEKFGEIRSRDAHD